MKLFIQKHGLAVFVIALMAYFAVLCVSSAFRDNALLVAFTYAAFILLFSGGYWLALRSSRSLSKQRMAHGNSDTQQLTHPSSSRQPGMDVLRIVAISEVILIHLFLHGYYTTPLTSTGMFCLTVVRWICMTCVPLFFLISGYLMKDKTPCFAFYKKVLLLITTYIVGFLIIFAYNALILKQITPLSTIITSILNYSVSGFVEQYIFLFLLIPFLNMIWRQCQTKAMHHWLLFTFLTMTTIAPPVQYVVPDMFGLIYPLTYYFIGVYIAQYRPRINKLWLLGAILTIGILLSVGSYLNADANGMFDWAFMSYGQLGYQILPVAAMTTLLALLCYNITPTHIHTHHILAFFSGLSFEIYLFGSPISVAICNGLGISTLEFPHKTLYFPLVTFATLILAGLAGKMLQSGIQLVYRRILRNHYK